LFCVAVFHCASPLFALDYTEATNGEFTDDRAHPTVWGSLTAGTNTLRGTTLYGDLDYFTINIPTGLQFSQLKMVSYDVGNNFDQTAFIGVQAGTVMTVPPSASTADGLLGWSHFGPGADNVGQDILPHMGALGFGAIGFVPPLPSNNYTFWIQQTGAEEPIGYQFEFVVTAATLAGDFDGNRVVDAADYVRWLKADGTPAGYTAWRGNFGATAASASSSAVPEPACGLLAMIVTAVGPFAPRTRKQ
jgi:hypothetical protein